MIRENGRSAERCCDEDLLENVKTHMILWTLSAKRFRHIVPYETLWNIAFGWPFVRVLPAPT